MTTLLDILDTAEMLSSGKIAPHIDGDYYTKCIRIDEDVRTILAKIVGKVFRQWDLNEFPLIRVKANYKTFFMDYENTQKLPKKKQLSFDQTGDNYDRYFGKQYAGSENKIVLPNQPNENLTSIALGKNPKEENLVYLIIEAGKDIKPGRIIRMKGNVDITKDKPILYGWIPSKSQRFKGHIEILIPKSLEYKAT
jgi:hypothetical protein